MERLKIVKQKKIIFREKIKESLSILFCICLLFIISMSMGIRLKLINSFFGYQPWLVKTQSMQPTLEPGDLIISSIKETEHINVNDIVVFKTEENHILTHRIISKEENGYITKGDANNISDKGTLTQKRIIGKQVARIPFLGKVALFAQTKSGILFIFISFMFVFVFKQLINLLKT